MLVNIFTMLAGLGAFLIGVNIMSNGMSKLADSGLKKLFGKISNNKFVGVGVGIVSTALIQSSSITTVMVVGFVNAGLLTLVQATTVIMGANIGTTITAQIAALEAFPFTTYATILTFIGVFITLFSKNEKVKNIGSLLSGLGLLFIGMNLMSSSAKIIANQPNIVRFLATINFPLLLLLIGAVLTAVLQSSAAVAIITISLVTANISIGSGGNAPLFIILGSNIGTCATALLSTVGGVHTNARRAALIHFMFNVFGSLIFLIVLWCWPGFYDTVFAWIPATAPGERIAMFHTLFNVACTLIFLPFTKMFVVLSEWLIPEKKEEHVTLTYIDQRFLNTPTIALTQSIKEVTLMGSIAKSGLNFAVKGFVDRNIDCRFEVDEKIKEVADLNEKITKYLVKISSNLKTYSGEVTVMSLHNVLSDIMRIADLSQNIVRYTRKVVENEIGFTPAVNVEIEEMFKSIDLLYQKTMVCFETRDTKLLKEIDQIEDQIDAQRKQYANNHITRLNNGECSPTSGGVYTNLISNMERIADHLTYVAHSIELKK